MPFQTIDELRGSDLFQRSPSLQKMPSFRLRRFVEVFSRLFNIAKGRGAPDDEAEANAVPLALAAARRFTPPPQGEVAEAEVHYFATMMPEQFSMGGEVQVMNFDFVKSNLPLLNAAVAGNTFKLGHAPEPLGVIRGLIPIEDAPPEVRAKAAEGTPFITVASYFEDTPDAIRDIDTVSAEWLHAPNDDGSSTVLLPDSFAVTEMPATDKVLGVQRLAEVADTDDPDDPETPPAKEKKAGQRQPTGAAAAGADNPYNEGAGLESQGQSMPDNKQVAADAELSAKLTEAEKVAAEAEARAKAAEEKHDALVAGLASLSGKETEDPETFNAEEAFASLRNEVKELNTRAEKAEAVAAELKAAAVQAEAENAAKALVDEGKIPSDAIDKWASLYTKHGSEEFEALAETLKPVHLRSGPAKAVAHLETSDDEGVMAEIDAALGISTKKGDA